MTRTNRGLMNNLQAIRIAAVVLAASSFTSCGVGAVEMNVVVFNYWPRAMVDVYVDGQHVGAGFGAFGPGGTGGSISCCHTVKAGKVKIEWMLGGGLGDPLTGKKMSATADLNEIKSGSKYLGVYLYPDGTVALDTAKGIPDDRRPDAKGIP
jgi:hypothetical protein